jgi:hypothetical protein
MGSRIFTAVAEMLLGMNLWSLGGYEDASAMMASSIAKSPEIGLGTGLRGFIRILALAESGRTRDAYGEARAMLARSTERPNARDEARARAALAILLLREGDRAGAEREALASVDAAALTRAEQMSAKATLASIVLAQGRPAEALALAEDFVTEYRALRGAFGFRGSFARLVHAEALRANGDTVRASEVLAELCAWIDSRARVIEDDALRKSFLEAVWEHRRANMLAAEWGMSTPGGPS